MPKGPIGIEKRAEIVLSKKFYFDAKFNCSFKEVELQFHWIELQESGFVQNKT